MHEVDGRVGCGVRHSERYGWPAEPARRGLGSAQHEHVAQGGGGSDGIARMGILTARIGQARRMTDADTGPHAMGAGIASIRLKARIVHSAFELHAWAHVLSREPRPPPKEGRAR